MSPPLIIQSHNSIIASYLTVGETEKSGVPMRTEKKEQELVKPRLYQPVTSMQINVYFH